MAGLARLWLAGAVARRSLLLGVTKHELVEQAQLGEVEAWVVGVCGAHWHSLLLQYESHTRDTINPNIRISELQPRQAYEPAATEGNNSLSDGSEIVRPSFRIVEAAAKESCEGGRALRVASTSEARDPRDTNNYARHTCERSEFHSDSVIPGSAAVNFGSSCGSRVKWK